MHCYLAMAINLDDNLELLMKYLDESGLAENSILVFTSDHGEMHLSHDRLNKMVLYAEAINIPLIIRWPGMIKANSRPEVLYTAMEHLPLLCGHAEIPIAEDVDKMDRMEGSIYRKTHLL
jgi:arylsulfatase A-like enzyme